MMCPRTFDVPRTIFVLACFLALAYATAQSEHVLEGSVPPGVPEGAVVAAQIVSDAGAPVGEPVATAVAANGRFALELPRDIAPALLEEERLGCDAEDLVTIAYLPYLTVLVDGEQVGRLVLTDMPRELWSFGLPPKHAYWLYAAETFTAEGACRGAELDLAVAPGWNPVLMIQGPESVSFTTGPAPESYAWRWAPAE